MSDDYVEILVMTVLMALTTRMMMLVINDDNYDFTCIFQIYDRVDDSDGVDESDSGVDGHQGGSIFQNLKLQCVVVAKCQKKLN